MRREYNNDPAYIRNYTDSLLYLYSTYSQSSIKVRSICNKIYYRKCFPFIAKLSRNIPFSIKKSLGQLDVSLTWPRMFSRDFSESFRIIIFIKKTTWLLALGFFFFLQTHRVVSQRCIIKKVFWKIPITLQKNTYDGVIFSIAGFAHHKY